MGSIFQQPQALSSLFGEKLLNPGQPSRSLGNSQRIAILREVLAATLSDGASVDAMDILTMRHGYRWAGHPDWEEHHRKLDALLSLMVEAGDVAGTNSEYRANGTTLRILAEADEEDRRHRGNWRIQAWLAVLALGTLGMTAAQAGLFKLPILWDWSVQTKVQQYQATGEPNATGQPR